ncbi:ciliary microtubule-associated protein 3 [Haemorhous mexicanus]|uniref:ciliary microtubule-associated protein 3 n=1 Tax=Haemorhous mexicanus TaxID=30427 RepID=UPI0028BECC85|nr:ciliary microtubule-associated protein 3 [Haemorhous mexicanus]
MAARPEPRAVTKLVSFGTTQERKMFPYSHAPDRLGIEVLGVRGDPSLGPGSYLGPESSALQSPLSTRPLSSRGYVMGARTAPRFQQKAQVRGRQKGGKTGKNPGENSQNTRGKQKKKKRGKEGKSRKKKTGETPLSPGPAAYGPSPARPRPAPPGPGPAPFGSSTPRFPGRAPDRDRNPGPGTYDPREPQARQVRWPGCFGAPDWARLPRPLPRMLRMQVQKMTVDKKFQKNLGREAYLRLYHG